MPSLVVMTPKVIRARLRVRKEIRACVACCSIHAARSGRPSWRIVLSQAVARSCLGAGRLSGMGAMYGVGGGAGEGVEGCNGSLEAMAQVPGELLGTGETWGTA